MRSLKKTHIKPGQTIILRADCDVPLEGNRIVDDFRLKAALATINFLLEKKAKIIIISHLGRPGGKVVKSLNLNPVADWFRKKLKAKVVKIDHFLPPKKLPSAQIILLENLRFSSAETENDLDFARKLASRGEIFVNDAFANSHRQHASIVGLPQFLPSYAGFQLEKEVLGLKKALKVKNGLVVILGGAKTETKIPVIERLVNLGAVVLLGGVVANTFLAALLGEDKVDGSLIDKERLDLAKKFLDKLDVSVSFAQIPGQTTRIWLPLDVIVGFPLETVSFFPQGEVVTKDKLVLDIGPKTIKEYTGLFPFAKAIILNGPLGKTEEEKFSQGTKKILRAIASASAFSIVGGGDTIALLEKYHLSDKIDLVSTGGGAMLEFLTKKTLPGIEALES